jgi:DNA-binding IclR family transcriptional regulator
MNPNSPRQPQERRDGGGRVRLLERIRAEFAEMPGLRLTRNDATRLWSLPEETCDRILQELERAGYLRRLDDGAYCLPDLGA